MLPIPENTSHMEGFDLQSLLFGAALSPLAYILFKSASTASQRPRTDSAVHASPLKVVITGSTKGLGLALAREFLLLGDDVVISSRNARRCSAVEQALSQEFPERQVRSWPCDISIATDAEALGAFTRKEFGRIDLWVNNAGVSQAAKAPLQDTDPAILQEIVASNLLGSIYGSRAALQVMRQQDEGGKIFLMDGAGARGDATPQNVAYGASKRALTQLKDSLAAEVKGTQVAVHITSPGMVITSLLVNQSTTQRSARFFNILAEQPHTVAAWMVPRMRGVTGNGKYFSYLTAGGVLWRFATAWRRRDRFFPQGVVPPGFLA